MPLYTPKDTANGHYQRTWRQYIQSMIRDLSLDYPDFLIASSEWFAFVPAKEYFDEPGDHADELETSVMMHYHPELVNLDEAGDGNYKKFASQMLNEKWHGFQETGKTFRKIPV